MNDDRKLDQLMDAWLDGGPSVAPHRVIEAARLEIRSTRQAAALPRWTRRLPSMSNTVRVGVAAAGVAVAAVLGFSLLASPNIGSPNAVDLPAASPAPDPSPTSTVPSPAASAGPSASYGVTADTTADGYELLLADPLAYRVYASPVTVLDPERLLVAVAGTWGKDSPEEPVPAYRISTVVNPPSRPDILELYWTGSCADEVVITLESTPEGIGITLDLSPGSAATTCQPRGFLRLMVAMTLAQPLSADRVEVTELRSGQPIGP